MTVKRGQTRQRVVNMAVAACTANGITCNHATNYRPATILTAQLPFIFTQRGRARYVESQYGTYSFEDRLALDLVIVIADANRGLIGQAEQAADAYFDIMQTYLQQHYRTSHDGTATNEVIELTLTGDQGVRIMAFDDVSYYAAVIDLVAAYERTIDYLGI